MKVLPCLYKEWNVTHLYHEVDTEHFWQIRDDQIKEFSREWGVEVVGIHGHTLYDPLQVVKANGNKPPLTITSFQKVTYKFRLFKN